MGIPQGTIIGPLLFNIYVNDLPKHLDEYVTIMFADDSNILKGCPPNNIFNVSDQILNKAGDWFIANKLAINKSKTNNLVFSQNRLNNNNTLYNINKIKMLGLVIDCLLKWTEQINYVANKLHSSIFMLTVLGKTVNLCTLKNVYFAYFQSCLSYARGFKIQRTALI